jgi:hypothetical protein
MSYFDKITALFDDASLDAFARLLVSQPSTQIDFKQLYDGLPIFYDDQETSGSGTGSTYLTNKASTRLSVSNTTAGTRVKQSKVRGFYQPGRGIRCLATFVNLTTTSGITKRVGYFDGNNGLFLQSKDGTVKFIVRSYTSGSPVDTEYTLENVDTVDWDKFQIIDIDAEWLGGGRVRCALNIDGQRVFIKKVGHANSTDVVYMSTPNLPIRYEISNDGTGAADTFDTVCGVIQSDGGTDDITKPVCAERGSTTFDLSTTAGEFTPLVSIRLKSGQIGARINPEEISLFCPTSSRDFIWRLILNPTITLPSGASDLASWTSIANSSIEYDITRDNTHVVTGGYELGFGYGASSNQVKSIITGTNRSYLTLGSNIDGSVDEIVLAVAQATTSLATSMLGGIKVGEYI